MKLLVANNYFYLRGGAERVMFNDIRSLRDSGIDVVPFSVSDPANVPERYSADFTSGVDVHAMHPLRRLRAAGEAIHCRRSAKAFAALIEKVRPDVLHCHNIYGRLTTSILPVARRYGLPVVLTVHDYKVVCPSYLMLRDGKPCSACVDGGYYRCAIYRCHKRKLAESAVYALEAYYAGHSDSYGAVDRFLCPSRFIADLLIRSGIHPKRVVFHPNSVDPDAYVPDYEGGYALYAGRLSREKGIGTLLDAVKGTDIPLKIAGTGPMDLALRAQAKRDGGSRIVFEGHCDGAHLAALYRNAAFVVVPSEWYENAPMSVLEAFAYGKPVVASRIGGIPEMVSDGENGYLFTWGSREELRAKMEDLWSDRSGRRRMGQNARRLVETRYSQRRRIESLLNIYADPGLSDRAGPTVEMNPEPFQIHGARR
jgi:glycosyltransferase involved in cell wall biosynthesis